MYIFYIYLNIKMEFRKIIEIYKLIVAIAFVIFLFYPYSLYRFTFSFFKNVYSNFKEIMDLM